MECAENQNVKDRLKQFIMFKNISTREFERQVGVSYGFIGNMSKSTSPDKVIKISHQFPELNITWLLTGDGDMLTKKNDSDCESQEDRQSLLATIASQQKTIERLTAMLDRLMIGDSEGKKEQKVG